MIFFRSTTSMLSLIALIVTAIGALVLVSRYLDLKREEEEELEPDVSPQSRLAEFERAFYAGQMDEAEFERIKAALTAETLNDPVGQSTKRGSRSS